MAPFAGFDMPVVYTSILDEHRKVRSEAGLFDVSHMGEIRVRGAGALAFAQRVFTNDVAAMTDGQVRYGALCAPDGGTIDDVTLYRVCATDLLFCVNAANVQTDFEWLLEVHRSSGDRCDVVDESDSTALLAIQGPLALEIAESVVEDAGPRPKRWRFREASWGSTRVWLSRTGYTGEDGYEIFAPNEAAERLWSRLLDAGAGRLVPIGLGARDTLRTEMGYPLYGHELDRNHDPVQAGLERFVAFGTGFLGETALRHTRDTGSGERLVGLVGEGRQVARPDYPIHTPEGSGRVTSGTFSPSIERSIAMGYVPPGFVKPRATVEVEVRGRNLPFQIVELPFYRGKR